MPKVYLLSRALDPILGVFTGLLAYHLSETNPRSNIPPGHTLQELIPWQLGVWREERRVRELTQSGGVEVPVGVPVIGGKSEGVDASTDVDWDKIRRELEGDKGKSA